MKLKTVIDSISLLSPLTGIGRYTYEISKRLEQAELLDIEYYYGYYSKKLINPNYHGNVKFLKTLVSKNRVFKKFARKALYTVGKFNLKKYDIYWQPNFIPLNSIKSKRVVTSVHDFSFLHYRDYHPKERIEYFEKYFFNNVKRSNTIITGSYFTKEEILSHIDIKEESVEVIYHGLNHNIFRVYKELDLALDLPKKFILSVGSIEPRKNLISLLKAYNSLSLELKKEYHLVLVGFSGWNNSEIMDIINKNRDFIHYLGYISDIELAKVYNLASLFVYPSYYEGFGLPPLEAMACGTAVVASNSSSIPEVGKDAILYCNPNSVDDIKDKIEKVLYNESMQLELSAKGLARAKEFSWEKSAKRHLEVFKKVYKD